MRTVLLLSATLCACIPKPSRVGKPPIDTPPPPTRLPLQMEPIDFLGVVIGIPAGTDIGAFHNDSRPVTRHVWGSEINVTSEDFPFVGTKELRAAGYRVLGYRGDNPLFGIDDSTRARYQLAGTITELHVDTYYSVRHAVVASLTVRWQLLDPLKREFILDATTTGRAEGRNLQHTRMVLLNAFRRAIRQLADHDDLERVLTRRKATPIAATGPLNVTACEQAGMELPRDMDLALDAVVVVRVGAASGSGAIVSRDGYVLTAAHVVAGAREATVKLRSGVEVEASVVRIDEPQDVAMLKVAGTGHRCLRAATDAEPRVGTEVFVLGAPLDEQLASSVTKGVVSGNRRIDDFDYLQTDASINPGNSGGPLLDGSGRVIAIASFKVVGQAVEGLGFGVPIKAAVRSLDIHWK